MRLKLKGFFECLNGLEEEPQRYLNSQCLSNSDYIVVIVTVFPKIYSMFF